MQTIKNVKWVVENYLLSSIGRSSTIVPPQGMIESIDQELSEDGVIARGEFVSYTQSHTSFSPQVVAPLSDTERLRLLGELFSHDQWICCARITNSSRYNAVVELKDKPRAQHSTSRTQESRKQVTKESSSLIVVGKCSRCGADLRLKRKKLYKNKTHNLKCECGAINTIGGIPSPGRRKNKPLGIHILSWFLIITGIIAALSGMMVLIAGEPLVFAALAAGGVYQLVMGIGLLKLKNWARVVFLVVTPINILLGIINGRHAVVLMAIWYVVAAIYLLYPPTRKYFKGPKLP